MDRRGPAHVVPIADRPLEITDPRQAAAMRRYIQPPKQDCGAPF